MGRFGDYEVLSPLASGGMGGVFLARHVASNDRVALKVLDPVFADHPEVVSRLYAELRVSARASHPGLVAIRAASKSSDDVPYLVMEYIEGETLAEVGEQLSLAAKLGVTAQIAFALAALHGAGVVHCDVKPENVLVLERGRWSGWPRIKVIDFGVARATDEAPPDDASVAGTPAYMAPEQWRGKPEPASDVYALGCVLFELVTGSLPFEGSLGELFNAHAERRPGRPSWLASNISIEVERLILRALAKEPAMRPTMTELAMRLDELAGAAPAGIIAQGSGEIPLKLAM
ncbi:MAG TPA: serine/threonine-protein kinase [Kofleriaceae bacterium]|nr:serine/threonine-protein kinase [Kofleriaceae bacterium]